MICTIKEYCFAHYLQLLLSTIKISPAITIQAELKPLSGNERNILRKIRLKKSRFFFYTFGSFLILLPIGYAYSMTWRGTSRGTFSEENIARLQRITPWFYLFITVLLFIYFINYYFKLIHPVTKDLKEGKKEVLYYAPAKYQTPFFAEYFIVTPLIKRSRVRISKDLFDEIDPQSSAAISYSIYSHFIFSIEVDGKEVKFDETNERVDT
jgi:hypothetical protein